MTDLPTVDKSEVLSKVVNQLSNENVELRTQVAGLEILCTALRDERDQLRNHNTEE